MGVQSPMKFDVHTSNVHTSFTCRVGLEGLGLDAVAVGHCKALVLQVPGEAAAALHRLRARADSGARAAFCPPTACLDEIQASKSIDSDKGSILSVYYKESGHSTEQELTHYTTHRVIAHGVRIDLTSYNNHYSPIRF